MTTRSRGGFAYEAPPSRGMDSEYVSDGAGEPYSAGRGERDDAFQYYARHPLPRVGAPTARQTPAVETGPVETAPVAMTCVQCHGGACMYQSPTAEPFCMDCNRVALQK